jgi:hypothetical protein
VQVKLAPSELRAEHVDVWGLVEVAALSISSEFAKFLITPLVLLFVASLFPFTTPAK